jgi:hypothetical protein
VLVLADVVEIVEAPVKHRMGLSQVKLSYGRPLKAFHNFLAGTETLVYDNFATDVRNDMLEKVIYFENRRPR